MSQQVAPLPVERAEALLEYLTRRPFAEVEGGVLWLREALAAQLPLDALSGASSPKPADVPESTI